MNPVIIRNEEDENRQVRRDMIIVLTLNSLFLAILFGLYFWNRTSGQVDNFFAQIFKF